MSTRNAIYFYVLTLALVVTQGIVIEPNGVTRGIVIEPNGAQGIVIEPNGVTQDIVIEPNGVARD